MTKFYYVYILTNKPNGILYTGMTSELAARMDQHKSGAGSSFTRKYNLHKLVHVEAYDNPAAALRREKNIKAWKRAWKITLIEKYNSDWDDLTGSVTVTE
jgi:putative endonuclease